MFLIRFLLRNLKGYYLLIVVAFVATILQVNAETLMPFPLKFIADKFVKTNAGSGDPGPPFNFFLNLLEPGSQGNHSASAVVFFSAILLIVLSIVSAALSYIQIYISTKIGQSLTALLRKKLFDHLQRLSLDWHGKHKKGDLTQRITGDITNIEKLVTDGLIDLLAGILTLVMVAVFMFISQVQLTLISLVILPALFVIVFTYTSSIKAAAKAASKAAGQVADVAVEDVGAITVLKAFSLEDREAIRFNKYVGKNQEAGMKAGALQAQFTPVVSILVGLGTAFILAMGSFAIVTGKFPIFNIPASTPVTVGTLTLFLAYLKQLYQPMRDLSKLTNVATSAIAGAERIQEVLDQAPEVLEPTAPYVGPQRLSGDIRFDNVIFGYDPERPILKGVSLHIPAGRKVALVGLSGGGKTTLIKLIPRFYEIQQGSVLLDNRDNRQYPLSVLRRNVSQVLQESVLFEGTILDNLKIGRPEASMEEIVDATRQAHIHDVIMSMPDGYNTKVREQGKNFSGGQRQRLAIARAILTNAPILILDEPTASLDVEAEAEVLRALETLVEGRTVLMISHRLSTLGNVDDIIVLKDGYIAEQGSYQELKRRNGIFAGLLKEQNRYNVDYAGKSMIVPRAEMMQMIDQARLAQQGRVAPGSAIPSGPQRSAAPFNAGVPVGPGAGSVGPGMPQMPNVRLNPGNFGPPDNYDAQRRNDSRPVRSIRSAHILVEVDGKIAKDYELNPQKPRLRVGRNAEMDIIVPSQRVSRFHATLNFQNGEWRIDDAESLNGLVFQGGRVSQHVLSPEDRIHLAPRVILRYVEFA